MSERQEAATPTAEQATQTETPESTEAAAEATPAEAETTEMVAGEKPIPGPVPYARFKEVNDARKAAEARLARIEARLAEMNEGPEEKPRSALPDPPEHLSPAEKVQWYVEHYSRAMIEREFGMPLDKVRAILGVTRELSADRAERQWGELCQANGVDPKDPTLRKEAADLLRAGVPPDKAAKVAAMIVKGATPQTGPRREPAQMENSGLDSTQMMKDDWTAWTKEEAVDAAKRGKRMPHLDSEEIFRRSKARGK